MLVSLPMTLAMNSKVPISRGQYPVRQQSAGRLERCHRFRPVVAGGGIGSAGEGVVDGVRPRGRSHERRDREDDHHEEAAQSVLEENLHPTPFPRPRTTASASSSSMCRSSAPPDAAPRAARRPGLGACTPATGAR